MSDPNKTVFISYRRDVSKYIARSVFQDLIKNDFDTFLDVEQIDSGTWETIILNQIAARTHFLLLLTPGTLNRCDEPNDMLRREIEQAMNLGRNIVLLLADNFAFKAEEKFLTGQLSMLDRYNGIPLYYEYFDEGMVRLRNRFLKTPISTPVLKTTPKNEISQVTQIIVESTNQPSPTREELSAEQFFSRAYEKYNQNDIDGAIDDYKQAIDLNSSYVEAYYNRALAFHSKDEWDLAIADYTQAISLKSDYAVAYNNRGRAYHEKGNYDAAIADFNKAIKYAPRFAGAFYYRARTHFSKFEYEHAIADFTRVLDIKPDTVNAYFSRGLVYYDLGNYDLAIIDFTRAIDLNHEGEDVLFYENRGESYFAAQQFDKALSDFKKTNDLVPGFNFALAGLAITHHAMDNKSEAYRLWKVLISMDACYKDSDWVKQELNWADPLVDEARKLIAGL